MSISARTIQWMEAACGYPLRDIQAAVDDCVAKGMACEATAYERREALNNAVFRSGYHVDRNDKVGNLWDLVGVHGVSLGREQDRPCVKFSVRATLEGGAEYLSGETFEWLDTDGVPVTEGRRLDVHVEPLVEAARALGAYMTDITEVVYSRLEGALPELRLRERVQVDVYSASQVSGSVVFAVRVDNHMLDRDGLMTAKLMPGREWQVAALPEDVRVRLEEAARATGASLSEVAAAVRDVLSSKLWAYEFWSYDEERERQEGELA